jgi:hypothetical protein
MGFSFKSIFKAVVTAAAIAAAVYFPAVALGLTSSTFAAYVGSAALMAAGTAVVSSLVAGEPPKFDISQSLRGQLTTTRSPSEATRIVYGETRLGGNVVFIETTGAKNETMYTAIAVAGCELTSLRNVYANDEVMSISNQGTYYTTTYKGSGSAVELAWFPGSDTQAANALFTGTAAANYQFKGIAVLATKLVYDQDVFPNGIPNFTVKVRGRAVYDPRSASTAYSSNAALCIRDYLTNTTFGLGATVDEIDDVSFAAAANICDQDVNLAAGGTEKRYTINGTFLTSEAPKDVLQKMLTACGGKLSYVGGKWVLKVAAWQSPTITLTENEIVSEVTMQASQSRRDIFNAVKGIYSEPEALYQPTSFPPITNGTYEAEDGEQIWKDVNFPFTTSAATCQRLAKIELEKARQQITFTVSCNLKAFALQPGDTVNVSFDRYGWSTKPFEVLSWSFEFANADTGPTPVVNLVLRETAQAIYDWSAEDVAVDIAPNTTLPDAFSVAAPTGLQVTKIQSILSDGSTVTNLLVEWVAPNSSFVSQYEVQWRRASDFIDYGLISANTDDNSDWGSIATAAAYEFDYGSVEGVPAAADPDFNSILTSNVQYTIPNVYPNTQYTIRVRAINSIGVRSTFASTTDTPTDDTTPPGDISNLIATAGFKQIALSWINPSAPDLDFIEVYRNNTNNLSGATRIAVTKASSYIDSGLGINVTWYYWLRPLDRTGNAGNYTSSVNATTLFIDTPDFSEAVNNLFTEAGAYGIEPVATLPATGDFDGQIKYDTTANKLYRWDAANEVWTDDIFSITAGSVDLASFASGIEPVSIVTSLPSPTGYAGAKIVFLTTDNKLYRYTGSAWTSAVAASDLSGTLAASNFSNSLRPVEVVSTLPTTGNFDGRTAVLTTDGKLYRYSGSGWTSAVPTTDLSGTISAGQIAANAITAGKIDTGAVTAGTIAAGAVSADALAANSVVAGKIAAAAVNTAALAAGVVTAEKIATGTITADKIAANSITGGLIAASGVITSAAQIDDAVITNAKIQNGAITTAKIGDAQITAAKINDGEITSAKIQNAAITSAKIGNAEVNTLQIASQAVTIPSSAYTAGSTSAGQVQSLTYTSTGAPTLVIASGTTKIYFPTFELKRNGTTIWSGRCATGVNIDSSFCASITDTPPAGSVTYSLYVYYNGGTNEVTQRSLSAIETKR